MHVADLAAAVNLSLSRFPLVFRAVNGHAPLEYLRRRRLDRARVLLETTFSASKKCVRRSVSRTRVTLPATSPAPTVCHHARGVSASRGSRRSTQDSAALEGRGSTLHDPTVPLNCPYCAARVKHERTEGETHYYTCARDGTLILPPEGRLRRVLQQHSEKPH